MNTTTLKFNKTDRPEFYKELNKRVAQYFSDNNLSKHGNFYMFLKTGCMLVLYFLPLVLMLTGVVSSFWGTLGLWALMGFGMSGIGFAVMHDANHGAYSSNATVNSILGFLINFTGGYHVNWKIQHNVLHHSFTNVHEMDEDIQGKGLIRLSPDQERKPMQKYQVWYTPLIYSIMTLYWFTAKDFIQLLRYEEKQLLGGKWPTLKSAIAQAAFHKAWYIALFLILPIMLISLPWWQTVIGFMTMHLICGLWLALVFQPAHVIEETNFFTKDEDTGSVENSWAIHQMMTTSNFAQDNKPLSWFVGGLNYQVEHHLFPHICHIHYKNLSPIVKATAKEFNVPYYEHKSFTSAIKSHFSLLNQLGTGEYDTKIARA